MPKIIPNTNFLFDMVLNLKGNTTHIMRSTLSIESIHAAVRTLVLLTKAKNLQL